VPIQAAHDELVVEAAEAAAEAAAERLRAAMIDGMGPLVAPIPAEVAIGVGRSWGAATG
jgi:DNA polymerase I-like protein with 3'-5' exonuclease and polymerase domains